MPAAAGEFTVDDLIVIRNDVINKPDLIHAFGEASEIQKLEARTRGMTVEELIALPPKTPLMMGSSRFQNLLHELASHGLRNAKEMLRWD